MNLLQLLATYNLWDGKTFTTGFTRQEYLRKIRKYLGNRLVKVITGQRRSGKSYFLRQIMQYLVNEQKVNPKNIFYFNKEFIGFEQIKNATDLNTFFELYKKEIARDGKIYIFLDEVQNISGWESFVNSYSQDFTQEYEIFVTGSNSKLLSGELATYLSGRYIRLNMFPFSFDEFIKVFGLPKNKDSYMQYISTSGLPELINFSDHEVRRNYVESLKDTIILRDIVARHNIKDVNLLEDVFRFLASNTGNLTSIPNIVKYYKSLGKKTNFETVSNYIRFLCDAFIFHEVNRYDLRGRKILGGVRKFYLNDLGFKNFLLGYTPKDLSFNIENQVFLELLKQGYKVYTGSDSTREIDFVAIKGEKTKYFQVAYILPDEKVLEREFGNLLNIKDQFPKYVVTLDDAQFSDYKGIKHIRAWELNEVL